MDNEPLEIEKVEARLAEWRMEFRNLNGTFEISMSSVSKMEKISKKIALAERWLCGQRAAMEASKP